MNKQFTKKYKWQINLNNLKLIIKAGSFSYQTSKDLNECYCPVLMREWENEN